MKILDLSRYGIRKEDVEQIVRPGEEFVIKRPIKNKWSNLPECFVFYEPREEPAIKYEVVELISTELKNETFFIYEVKRYRYIGNDYDDYFIIKHAYEDENGKMCKKYILGIPDQIDEIIYKPNFINEPILSAPGRLMNKWIKECSEKEKRDPEHWYKYARVERCVGRKEIIYSLFEYSKKYKDYPIVSKYATYHAVENGSVVIIDVYAVLINGNLSFIEDAENVFKLLQDYDKIVKVV